ncbi:MAG: alpha/beta hydrolase [Rhodocyclaceae bacterium]|nr:alpha/beta hydrolase [Rhodocyclaceae bacterium]
MSTTLIIPGRNGSGPGHWQTWLESRVAGARRVTGIDWDQPAIQAWSGALVHQIDRAAGEVWLVAHSFGCLAALLASARRPTRIAGAMLVAPADPELFNESGLRDWSDPDALRDPAITRLLPHGPLPYPALLVLSGNDPWLRLTTGLTWASRWGARAVHIGTSGHINEASGHGPWPEGLALFERFRDAHQDLPTGALDAHPLPDEARRRENRSAAGLGQTAPGHDRDAAWPGPVHA